jgi:WD40 repeat protein/tRNA A-37 threonylcarbamoyl transferase component Bud32
VRAELGGDVQAARTDRGDPATSDDPLTLLEWVDAVADRFEAGWRGGRQPDIADYLGGVEGKKRTALVHELVRIDRERRARVGSERRWEDYLKEFPELLDPNGAAGSCPPSTPLPPVPEGPVRVPFVYPAPGPRPALPERPVIDGYEILGELGRGGMGTVYKARQKSLKRVVALKVIRSAGLGEPQRLARFQAEAEAVARLQHPNIVQIYEVGRQDGTPYFSLEYVEGGSLADRLAGKPQAPRESAALAETLARAMHYAHQRSVIHRDLKPANVLLAGGGGRTPLPDCVPKITDFGLAKQLEGQDGRTLPGVIVGTPSYMAPEQAEGRANEVGPLADVYSLGATLYELVTGRPPFGGETMLDTLEQVRSEEPVPPARLVPRLPADLQTICLKAMVKAPARRYGSALALAEDLRRFLNGQPVQARPVGTAERLWRWCRRNPARAGLAATAGLLLLTVVVASVLVALASAAREQARKREALVQQLQLVRLDARTNGWSDEAWGLVVEAASLRRDDRLRTQAAATCAGMDARPGKHLEKVSASSVAFDAAGGRLLFGGRGNGSGPPVEGAKLWDLGSGRLEVSSQAGPGPVAFGRDGRPLQLVPRGGPSLLLCDMAVGKAVSACRLTAPAGAGGPSAWAANELGFPVLTLSPDGTRAAAAAIGPGAKGAVAVWEAASGRLLFQADESAGTLALSPAGDLLAGSDSQGRVRLWSVPEGRLTATLQTARATIHCLAFRPDGRRLAVGDSTGAVTVWDVPARHPVTYCYGSHHDVYALAFSPDGTVLASGGRGPPRLWDAASGRLLLSLQATGPITGLAFAPDARRLVVASKGPSRVALWELEEGRGIQTFRGLTSQAAHVCFSEDGRFLAALAHNWQAAVWELETGQLRRVLDAPQGGADDDAGLAFSPDGRRFACAAGEEAKLWDVVTGHELGVWRLPPGVKDQLAFHAAGALLLFRVEGGESVAAGDAPGPRPPRVGRLRNLLGPQPARPIVEVTEFNRHFLDAVAAPDGSCFLAEGVHEGPDGRHRTIKALDGLTGAARWSIPSTRSALSADLALDPAGRFLAVRTTNADGRGSLVDVASGRVVDPLAPFPTCLGPGARYLVLFGPREPPALERGFSLFRRGDSSPLLVLGVETTPAFRPVFDRAGNFLAWSNTDGTVSVCNLRRVQARLAQAGLGW